MLVVKAGDKQQDRIAVDFVDVLRTTKANEFIQTTLIGFPGVTGDVVAHQVCCYFLKVHFWTMY